MGLIVHKSILVEGFTEKKNVKEHKNHQTIRKMNEYNKSTIIDGTNLVKKDEKNSSL